MKRLKEMPPSRQSGKPRVYNWDKILDGSIWELKQGEDFKCSMPSFRKQLYRVASDRRISITARFVDDVTVCVKANV